MHSGLAQGQLYLYLSTCKYTISCSAHECILSLTHNSSPVDTSTSVHRSNQMHLDSAYKCWFCPRFVSNVQGSHVLLCCSHTLQVALWREKMYTFTTKLYQLHVIFQCCSILNGKRLIYFCSSDMFQIIQHFILQTTQKVKFTKIQIMWMRMSRPGCKALLSHTTQSQMHAIKGA
jgi:hypothetical protein